MNFLKTTAASLVAMTIAGSAFAADLPSRKAPLLPPPPVFTWTGFYIGLNAGGVFGGGTSTIVGNPTFAAATFASEAAVSAFQASQGGGSSNKAGFIGGGQVGYNWQFANTWVTGIEADIQGLAGRKGSSVSTISGVPGFPAETIIGLNTPNRNASYLGTVRGRFGYLITPTFLLYATGGLAYGSVKSASVIQQDVVAGGSTFSAPYASTFAGGTRVGYTVGGGVEWMFFPNWSLKAEYLYYNLGKAGGSGNLTNLFTTGGPAWSSSLIPGGRVDGHIARLGINYHFFAPVGPVVAKY